MVKRKNLIKAKTYQYITLSDGFKKSFSNKDALKDYPNNIIRDPNKMSFTNLYINGVLQPTKNYTVRRGKLQLNTIDAPPKDAPIVLQFIKLSIGSSKKKRKKRARPIQEYEEE